MGGSTLVFDVGVWNMIQRLAGTPIGIAALYILMVLLVRPGLIGGTGLV